MLAGASTVTEKFRKQKRTAETKERIVEIIIIKKKVSCARVQKTVSEKGEGVRVSNSFTVMSNTNLIWFKNADAI